jgi:hypothetical protein
LVVSSWGSGYCCAVSVSLDSRGQLNILSLPCCELTPLEQFEIVLASLAYCDTDDLARLVCDDDLRCMGVPLLLPAGVLPLFFWGRSRGLSATSTTITLIGVLPARNFFLPGT